MDGQGPVWKCRNETSGVENNAGNPFCRWLQCIWLYLFNQHLLLIPNNSHLAEKKLELVKLSNSIALRFGWWCRHLGRRKSVAMPRWTNDCHGAVTETSQVCLKILYDVPACSWGVYRKPVCDKDSLWSKLLINNHMWWSTINNNHQWCVMNKYDYWYSIIITHQ